LVEVEMSSFGIRSLRGGGPRARREELLTLSQKERDRLVAVRQVAEGLLTMQAGARKYGVGLRHMRRRVRRYEQAQEEE
jgi:hypothetical protein